MGRLFPPSSSPPSSPRGATAIVVVLACLFARSRPAVAAEGERIPVVAGIAGGALGLSALLTLFEDQLAPSACRICASNRFDESVRDTVKWDNPKDAKWVSDGLLVAIPASAIAGAFAIGAKTDYRRGFEDALLVVESVSIAGLGSQIVKLIAARERPFASHGTGTYAANTDDHLSYFSGHTALTMAAATSLATVERLRGNSAWPYLMTGGMALALTTGYLRMGADKHWFSDVLSGAGFGAAAGLVVPRLHLGRTGSVGKENGVTVLATPFALMGTF